MKNERPWNIGLTEERFKEVADAGVLFKVGNTEFRTSEPVPELDGNSPFEPSIVLVIGETKVYFPTADSMLDEIHIGNKALRNILPSIKWWCEGACH